MAEPGGGGSDRRRWPRVALSAYVSLSSPSVQDLVDGPLHDISLGGLFIRTSRVRPIGTEVTLLIRVPTESLELETRGIVVRSVSAEESLLTGRLPGMGVVFTGLDDAARESIERLIQAALGT